MVQVLLKSDEGKPFMQGVNFPVSVRGELNGDGQVFVRSDELLSVGARDDFVLHDSKFTYGFLDFDLV